MEGQLPWDQLPPVSLQVSPQLGLVLFQEVQLPPAASLLVILRFLKAVSFPKCQNYFFNDFDMILLSFGFVFF